MTETEFEPSTAAPYRTVMEIILILYQVFNVRV